MTTPCPCRSGEMFVACCGPYLRGEAHAPTAEALMRSRYTAFCKGAIDYLVETRHPSARTSDERADARRSVTGTQWLNLMILDTRKGRKTDRDGHVEFVAAYRPRQLNVLMASPGQPAAEPAQMHENSFFAREGDRWFYVDGDSLPPHRPARGDPCWCGSGKKAKLCHGA